MHRTRVLALCALLAVVVSGCSTSSLCPCNWMRSDAVASQTPSPEPNVAWTPPSARPPVSARKIVLRGVNFKFDSYEIRPEDQAILDAAIESLKGGESARLQVAGHTDSIGTEDYNQGLSERRARAVRDYLTRGGASAQQLEAVGFGEARPVADNGTRDGRTQNRRVELNID